MLTDDAFDGFVAPNITIQDLTGKLLRILNVYHKPLVLLLTFKFGLCSNDRIEDYQQSFLGTFQKDIKQKTYRFKRSTEHQLKRRSKEIFKRSGHRRGSTFA